MDFPQSHFGFLSSRKCLQPLGDDVIEWRTEVKPSGQELDNRKKFEIMLLRGLNLSGFILRREFNE
jgi:hypothetical protein